MCTSVLSITKCISLVPGGAWIVFTHTSCTNGGMGVRNPVETSKVTFATSRAGTSNIVDAIKGCKQFSTSDHSIQMSEAASAMRKIIHEDKLTSVLATLDPNTRRAITRSVVSPQRG